MAGVNHTGNNHGTGSRTNSLEPPMDSDMKIDQHRDFRLDEDGPFGLLATTEIKRRHSFRNKKVNWQFFQQYNKLENNGENSPVVGGSESGLVLKKKVLVSEVELLLAGLSQDRYNSIIISTMDLQNMVISDSRGGSLESLTHPGERHHLHHSTHPSHHSRSPSLRRNSPIFHRSPSPGRHRYDHHSHQQHFSDTVNNVVEIQRHSHQPHLPQHNHRHKIRGPWSASTSPARSPSPVHPTDYDYHYGTTSLDQRSRSPSPIEERTPGHPHHHYHHPHQHSYPVLVMRRGQGRRLPPTPNKPSTLQLKPSNINFPKLNASPTHGPHIIHVSGPQHVSNSNASHGHGPLSFEQAVAMGRGGRMLPSPVPNGYKPQPVQTKQRTTRSKHSDSDEDDWC